MDLYDFVRIIAERSDLNLPQRERERLVGTLRSAGFSESLRSRRDKEQALAVISSQLHHSRTERVAASTKQGSELFRAIQELNRTARCGKCQGSTETAKLASGEEVNFCPKCRVVMWKASGVVKDG